MKKTQPLLGIFSLVLAISVLSGCGKKEDAQKADVNTTTQVAAKVNTEEITVHQINSALARTPNIPAEAATQAKYEILGKLIEQQLAKQQALEKKLDRTPAVMQAIEYSRNEILARAYLDQVIKAQPRPTPEETKKYYDEHPELFAQRRIFSLQEIVLTSQEGMAAKLRGQLAKAKSLQDIADWLKNQNIEFAPNRGVRPAEALPLNILPEIHAMKDGEMRLLELNNRIYIFRLLGSKAAPVDEKTAAPRIQQYLFNRKSADVVSAEIKRLKASANVEYVGEFSGGAAAAAEKAKAEAEAKTQAAAQSQAEAEQEAKERAEARAKAQAEADARADAIAKARREAEAKAKSESTKATPDKLAPIPRDIIDKGVRGLK